MSRTWIENLRSPLAWVLFIGTAAIGLTLDLWSKAAAVTHLERGRVIQFIRGWLHFEYTTNEGAVFGLGQGQKALFVVVSVAAIGFLFYLFATSGKSRIYQFVLGMLLAGVIGNMYDRLRYGHVRDMIHAVPWVNWPKWFVNLLPQSWQRDPLPLFPWIFNVADSLLCVGVGAMIVFSVIAEHRKKKAESLPASPASADA